MLLSHLLTGMLLALFGAALSLVLGASALAAAAWYVVGGVIGVVVSVLVNLALECMWTTSSRRPGTSGPPADNSILVTIRSYLAHQPKQR